MHHIEIEPTDITPQVILNPIDGKCLFKGNSILFDVDQFYIPLTNWFDKFLAQKHQPKIEVVFELDNCNVLSIERIAIILQRLEITHCNYQVQKQLQSLVDNCNVLSI